MAFDGYQTVYGYCDRLGYLYCAACARRLDIATEPTTVDGYPQPITCAPHIDDPCESCGHALRESAGHVGYTWTIEGGLCEVVRYAGAIVRAPLSAYVNPDGNRHGREWWPDRPQYEACWRPITWDTATAARDDMRAREG